MPRHLALGALLLILGLSAPGRLAAAPAPELKALLAKTEGLRSNQYQRTLDDTIRDLKDDAAEEAACALILAVVEGDVAAFMRLVPEKGLRVFDENKKRRSTSKRADVEKQAASLDEQGRPRFVGLLNEAADVLPRELSWGVELRKGRLRIAANGAFAWADLRKVADGRFLLEQITISANND
jgi:hypothetical protein